MRCEGSRAFRCCNTEATPMILNFAEQPAGSNVRHSSLNKDFISHRSCWNPVSLAHKFGRFTVSKFSWRVIGPLWAFSQENLSLDVAGSDWEFFIQRAGTIATARRFLQDAVIHSRSFIPKTLLKLASQDKTNVLCMIFCRWYQFIVLVCVFVSRFWSFRSETRGTECGMPSRVLSSFGTCKFLTKRLSEMTNGLVFFVVLFYLNEK